MPHWGIESIWEYNGLIMNDREEYNSYLFDQISGFRAPGIREDRSANPTDHGDRANTNPLLDGKNIVIDGRIRARNWTILEQMTDAMYQAFGVLEELPLLAYPRPGWPYEKPTVQIYCRVSSFPDIVDSQPNEKYERPFQLTLHASNPRIISPVLKVSSGHVPLDPGGPSYNEVFIECLNEGQFTAQADIHVTAAGENPYVEIVGFESLYNFQFNANIPDIDDVAIAYTNGRRAVLNGNNNRSIIGGGSKWIHIPPGLQQVRFYGLQLAFIQIKWNDTWM